MKDIIYINNLINYDIQQFLQDTSSFITDGGYQDIIDYYSGKADNASARLEYLSDLIKRSDDINNIIRRRKDVFDNIEYWDLIELLDNIRTTLHTIKNTPKWIRSSGAGVKHDSYIQNHTLRQGDTLEDVSRHQGYSNYQDDWASIAISNDLTEESYTTEGGNILKLVVPKHLSAINDVVAELNGYEIYGRDIKKKLTYENDDLVALEPKEHLSQTFDILFSIKKGSVPEFANDGIPKIVGSSRNAISIPTLFRKLTSVLMSDDIIEGVELIDLSEDNDIIKLSVSVSTKISKDIIKEIIL